MQCENYGRMVKLQLGFNPIDAIILAVAGSMEFLPAKGTVSNRRRRNSKIGMR